MRETLLRYARVPLRLIRRSPLYVLGAALPLALGIGGTIGVVTLVEHVLAGQEPWRDPDTLFLVARRERGGGESTELAWSYPAVRAMQQLPHRVIESVQPAGVARVIVTDGRGSSGQLLRAELVNAEYFRTVGVAPQLGRLDDGQSANAFGAVISDRLWRQHFAADPEIVGRPLTVNGKAVSVAGVAPAGFDGITGGADIWLPLSVAPTLTGIPEVLGDQYWGYMAVARTNPGIPAALRDAELRNLGRELSLGAAPTQRDLAFVTPRQARVQITLRRALLLLLAAAVCVLLLVCANVAALAVVRTLSLRDDIRVRVALGASQTQVASRFLSEGTVIAVLSLSLGVLVSHWVVDALWAARPAVGVSWMRVLATLGPPAIGARSVAAMVVILIVVVALVALWPAMQARVQNGDAISPGFATWQSTGRTRSRLRISLVAVQVAFAFLLTQGALLLLFTVTALGRETFGVRRDGVVVARLQLPRAQFGQAEAAAFYDALMPRLASIPGVDGVSVDRTLPLASAGDVTSLSLPGSSRLEGSMFNVRYHTVEPAHFHTLRIPLTRGRTFEPAATLGQPREVVVSETAARQIWDGANPIGATVLLPGTDVFAGGATRATVVGVAADVQYDRPGTPSGLDVYVAARADPPLDAFLLLHAREGGGDARRLLGDIGRVVRSVDSRALVLNPMTLEDWTRRATSGTRYVSAIVLFYALLAVTVALLGVHAVVAYHVALRTREFGIMRAVGAPTRSIALDVMRRGVLVCAGGIAIGLLGTALAGQLLRGQLYGVGAYDPGLLSLCVALFLAMGIIGSLIPALRAVRVDPALALTAT